MSDPVTCGITQSPNEHQGYFLGAQVVNAKDYESAQVEWIIVHRSTDDQWHDNDGNRVLVFFTEPITIAQPSIPEGWIEYVHEEAQKDTARRREEMRPSGLAALLARKAEAEPVQAPIARRGF